MVDYLILASYLAVTCPVSGCCMMNTEFEFSDDSGVFAHSWLDSEYMFCICMRRFWCDSNPEVARISCMSCRLLAVCMMMDSGLELIT